VIGTVVQFTLSPPETSNIQHPTSNIQHPTSNIQHPIPFSPG
jgi:hypothetical protein